MMQPLPAAAAIHPHAAPRLAGDASLRIAVVLPCWRVTDSILDVLASIGPECERIYVIDDACPDGTGALVETDCADPRVRVLRNSANLGVGGAVLTGYRQALADGMHVIVKIDGDGQMDPALLMDFVQPIAQGEADYCKGNRFYDLDNIHRMPALRILGNAGLSLMAKLSTGYWDLFDPTNGYTAIHRDVAIRLPMAKISPRYFFETDLLFRLGTQRAVVRDVPMDPRYGEEVSGLKIHRILGEFAFKHTRNFCKRVFYNYYLRDMSLASLELVIGLPMLLFGLLYGMWHWIEGLQTGRETPTGTIMLATLATIVGLQFVLAFLGHDISSVPRRALSRSPHRISDARLAVRERSPR
ncbi:MAG: glycosyltransferase family 2 protein [Lysobacteraceae bacterium]